MGLDDQLCFALYDASRMVAAAYQDALTHLGLTYTQFLVMLALWEQDEVTVSDLGRRVQLDSGTLSPLLRRLEGRGIVQRRRERADGRQVTVHLTDSGRALEHDVAQVHECLAQRMPLPVEQLIQLRDLTKTFCAALRSADPTPTVPPPSTQRTQSTQSNRSTT